jgi:hypothetical protein
MPVGEDLPMIVIVSIVIVSFLIFMLFLFSNHWNNDAIQISQYSINLGKYVISHTQDKIPNVLLTNKINKYLGNCSIKCSSFKKANVTSRYKSKVIITDEDNNCWCMGYGSPSKSRMIITFPVLINESSRLCLGKVKVIAGE